MSPLAGSQSTKSGLIFVRRKWSGQDVQSGEWRRVVAVDEAEHPLVVLHGADEALVDGDLAADERNNLGDDAAAVGLGERLMLPAAEGLLALVLRLDVAGGAVDDFERRLVAGLVVVTPTAHAVVA